MDKKITLEWLNGMGACSDGREWFSQQKETDGLKIVKKLIKEERLDWANWLIVRLMSYKQYVSYAIYAAEQVIDIFEKQYPEDKRPRIAIEDAKKCLKNPTTVNKSSAGAAAWSAWDAGAARAAWAAWSAWAARAAGAARAARAAGAARAARAAGDAARAAGDAGDAMQLKILNYGISLLGVKNG